MTKKFDISAADTFRLFDTYGFPLEMTVEMAKEKNLAVDQDGFHNLFREHQKKSRGNASQKFKGGIGENSPEATRLHTATHLLQAALRKILGDHVRQKGSNITSERLRFDFSHPQKMTDDEKTAVEKYVNDAIAADIPILCEEINFNDAIKNNALTVPHETYPEKVKVYTAHDWTHEVCGGPHVEKTGELGTFKIKKEESSSAGVRRIKATLN